LAHLRVVDRKFLEKMMRLFAPVTRSTSSANWRMVISAGFPMFTGYVLVRERQAGRSLRRDPTRSRTNGSATSSPKP
jgi:hypothetical protein